MKKIFVSGCFDMLHSGHVAFLKEAASFGDLYVCIGNDDNINELKGRFPVNSQDERKYMIEALASVKECRINAGFGFLDFVKEIEEIKPDIFVVNEDGNSPDKEKLCAENGIKYLVLKRIPHENLPKRSTTTLKNECNIPYRIDLAGGWLDQPYVSKYYPGSVITISIEPSVEFNERSGMASSTRRKAMELWQNEIPNGDKEKLAKLLFSWENPPGKTEVAGSQDSLGIVLPGLNNLRYDKEYWPMKITSVQNEEIISWLENHIYIVNLGPRKNEYNVLEQTQITEEKVKLLSIASDNCWQAILDRNIAAFGKYFTESYEHQISMFPKMEDNKIKDIISKYSKMTSGYKLSGAGGGGYLILISDRIIENAIQIKIRRSSYN